MSSKTYIKPISLGTCTTHTDDVKAQWRNIVSPSPTRDKVFRIDFNFSWIYFSSYFLSLKPIQNMIVLPQTEIGFPWNSTTM